VNYLAAKEPLGGSHSVCTLSLFVSRINNIGLISIQPYCALREAGMEVLEEKAQQRGEEE
jgi:hypothetical protein